jgi:predicted small lipoprotein YifL
MKRNIIIPLLIMTLIIFITLSGCSKKKPEVKEPSEKIENTNEVVKEDENQKEKIMKNFKAIVESDNGPDAIIKYIEENIGKVSQLEGDKMISDLERTQEKYLETYTDMLLDGDKEGELMSISSEEMFFPEEKIKDIKNKELKEIVSKIFNSKYKLINLEGAYYPIIDYEKLKVYNNHITDEWKEYIAIKSIDSNEPAIIDAGLRITFDDLASRMVKIESFIKKYSEGQRYEEMLRWYGGYLKVYLGGVDNTPIANNDTKKIHDDVFDSYKRTSNMKNTVTSEIVSKYISIIEDNNRIINDTVTSKITGLYNEAISLLEEHK